MAREAQNTGWPMGCIMAVGGELAPEEEDEEAVDPVDERLLALWRICWAKRFAAGLPWLPTARLEGLLDPTGDFLTPVHSKSFLRWPLPQRHPHACHHQRTNESTMAN